MTYASPLLAIVILEDSCQTNAGFGSNLTWDGSGKDKEQN